MAKKIIRTKASIFVPTKNAGNYFEKVLTAIFSQKYKKFEVIIVDSGSSDNTLEIAKKFNVNIYRIKPEKFGHARTRNLALKYSKGEYIVFLTQDAIPANDSWLFNLIKNFNDKMVAGAFSKQVARADARETEKFFYHYHFQNKRKIRSREVGGKFGEAIYFSNVSSCIRKSLLKKYPFDESLVMSEDQQFARDVLNAGYKTVYEPDSVVIHSHNYNLLQLFKRYCDSASSLGFIAGRHFGEIGLFTIKYMVREFFHILLKEPLLVPFVLAQDIIKITAVLAGLVEK